MSIQYHILECEKVNKQLKDDIEYYKRQNKRLKNSVNQLLATLSKLESAIKTNSIEDGEKFTEVCCEGDYLLSIIERGRYNA